jgi:hypothetical protein
MTIARRQLLAIAAAGAAAGIPTRAAAAPATSAAAPSGISFPLSALGVDAAHFGVHAGSSDDQTKALQRAIEQAAGARVPLALAYKEVMAATIGIEAAKQAMPANDFAERPCADASPAPIQENLCKALFKGGWERNAKAPSFKGWIRAPRSAAARRPRCRSSCAAWDGQNGRGPRDRCRRAAAGVPRLPPSSLRRRAQRRHRT